jgi:hypothetical protein
VEAELGLDAGFGSQIRTELAYIYKFMFTTASGISSAAHAIGQNARID